MTTDASVGGGLLTTPLHARHIAAGARMVGFAGYDMPVQYADGILAEHRHTRAAASLFDVSHMGQITLSGPDHATLAATLEALTPGDILGLQPGHQRYSVLLNEQGGIIDDLMIARPEGADGTLELIVNASRKQADAHYLSLNLPDGVTLRLHDERALLALQGPAAGDVLARFASALTDLPFMSVAQTSIRDIPVSMSRSGYTGEDGFELTVAGKQAGDLWDILCAIPAVKPAGLGARDSLRLEAGLCLYGHDINEETSPIEASLGWTVAARRRTEGGFPGHRRILGELETGPLRQRVGLLPQGRMPARAGADISNTAGELIGEVTSGGFGPTVDGPVAMGYVVGNFSTPGTRVSLGVRGREVQASIVPLPFVAHRYKSSRKSG